MFCLLFKHKKLFLKISLFWSHLNAFEYADFFRSESDFGRILKRLSEGSRKTLGRLSSNVFYARRLPRNLQEVFCPMWHKGIMSSGVQVYLCWGIISTSMCNSFIYGLFYDLYVYYFSCEFFCKLEEMLIKRIW